MKRKEVFEHCGFSYALTLEEERVKRVEPAAGMANVEINRIKIVGLRPDLSPFTVFESRVMEKAMEIPQGKVATYGGLARAVGRPKAVRAVGNVMARNPTPIIVPCHRVVRSDLTIGGYAHGSERKMALLKAEGIVFEDNKVRRDCLYSF